MNYYKLLLANVIEEKITPKDAEVWLLFYERFREEGRFTEVELSTYDFILEEGLVAKSFFWHRNHLEKKNFLRHTMDGDLCYYTLLMDGMEVAG